MKIPSEHIALIQTILYLIQAAIAAKIKAARVTPLEHPSADWIDRATFWIMICWIVLANVIAWNART